MRCLYIKAGKVVNIVEHADPPETDDGADVVPAVTGLESIGDNFDVTQKIKDRAIDKFPMAIFQELFRLTNAVRTLNSQATITPAQYRAFLKTLF